MLVYCMQKYAADVTNEQTISVISLPNDEMKGRIIGREGRNVRTIESVTGVDLIIDDTPEAIVISSFDPLRREIARLTLETLIKDGRIHPARIEEVYDKMCNEINQKIKEYGKNALYKNRSRVNINYRKITFPYKLWPKCPKTFQRSCLYIRITCC